MSSVLDGIIIGGAGGAVAGLTVYGVQYLHHKIRDWLDCAKILKWLQANTKDETGSRFRSTRAIASWTNFTQERVRFLCSLNEKIYLSTGPQEDMWGIYQKDAEFPKPDEMISG